MALIFEPSSQLPGEVDLMVAKYLKSRRITIVGGVPSDALRDELIRRFRPDDLRWLGAQPGSHLNLDPLDGLQARVDVVYCVTGHIGHDGSIKAQKCCRKRGVEIRKVADAKQIVGDLCDRHGCPAKEK
jgi:hypothetical protein